MLDGRPGAKGAGVEGEASVGAEDVGGKTGASAAGGGELGRSRISAVETAIRASKSSRRRRSGRARGDEAGVKSGVSSLVIGGALAMESGA
jgi:hypothetical protein